MAAVPLRSGELFAVDLSSGRIAWKRPVTTATTPAIADGRIYVETGTNLLALDAATGDRAWQTALGAILSAPLLSHGGWIIAGTDTEVIALRASDGVEVWRRALGVAMTSRPAMSGDSVFISLGDGRIIALDVKNGNQLWERRLPERGSGITAPGGQVFVGSTDNFFYCLAEDDGDRQWRWRTGADITGSAAVDDSRVYFVSLDNLLRALNRSNGVQRWRAPLGMRSATGPVLAGGLIVVAGQGAELRAYDMRDGSRVGEHVVDATFVGQPHLLADAGGPTLVVMNARGELQALRHSMEPPLIRLDRLPGRRLPPEPPPVAETSSN